MPEDLKIEDEPHDLLQLDSAYNKDGNQVNSNRNNRGSVSKEARAVLVKIFASDVGKQLKKLEQVMRNRDDRESNLSQPNEDGDYGSIQTGKFLNLIVIQFFAVALSQCFCSNFKILDRNFTVLNSHVPVLLETKQPSSLDQKKF